MYTAHVQQRFSDLDVLGHVNNVAYIEYLQEARVQYLTSLGRVDFSNPGQVVAKLEITYRKPLGLLEAPLQIEIWSSHVRERSYVLHYNVLNELGEVAAEANTVMVVFDLEKGESTRIPDHLRALLEA